ncbi:hypothetical protein NKJ93_33110 [Mesorhizobium sp. M0028]|uniref:hypothetical protein n=1 Tax=Mesorhizobium sp. M0028 TaxID=2956849 RepID=UPI00333805C9
MILADIGAGPNDHIAQTDLYCRRRRLGDLDKAKPIRISLRRNRTALDRLAPPAEQLGWRHPNLCGDGRHIRGWLSVASHRAAALTAALRPLP